MSTLNGSNGFSIEGLAWDQLGYAFSVGDLNDDGNVDLVVGAPGARTQAGIVYVIYGPVDESFAKFNLSTLNGTNGFVIEGENMYDRFGEAVCTESDLNGDGISDLVVGASWFNGVSQRGKVYVIFGKAGEWLAKYNLTTLNGTNGFAIEGLNNGNRLGHSLNMSGDLNGDGISDLAIGALWTGTLGDYAATAFVIFGQKSSEWPANFQLTSLDGTNGFAIEGMVAYEEEWEGYSVSAAGDLNGDSISDLLAATYWRAGSGWIFPGNAYAILGQASGWPANFSLATLNGTNGFVIEGLYSSGILGFSVITVGDINYDGKSDLLVGTDNDRNSQNQVSTAYVILGQDSGWPANINLTSLNGSYGFVIEGLVANDWLGYIVSTASDLNGDGISDMVFGAHHASPGGQTNAGTVYVIYGLNIPPTPAPTPAPLPTPTPAPTPAPTPTSTPAPTPTSAPVTIPTPNPNSREYEFELMSVSMGEKPSISSSNFSRVSGVVCGIIGLGGLIVWLYFSWPLILKNLKDLRDRKSPPNPKESEIELMPVTMGEESSNNHPYVLASVNPSQKSLQNNNIEISPVTVESTSSSDNNKAAISTAVPVRLDSNFHKHHPRKSWHFDSHIKALPVAKEEIYKLVDAADHDMRKVIEFYQHCPVSGYEIASIRVVHNPGMNKAFVAHIEKLQQRYNNPKFKAKWPTGTENIKEPLESAENTKWRHCVYDKLQTIAKPYVDSDYPAVSLVPMWHGTQKEVLEGIFKAGYANLATTDVGFFGKGIYSAYEAEYSHRVYAKEDGALIVNWVACFSAYPVIDGDMKKFEGKGNYSNYDAHFIPVAPHDPDNPYSEIYYPTKPNEKHQYMELVVFESAACLPRYLVQLQHTMSLDRTFFQSSQEEMILPDKEEEIRETNIIIYKTEKEILPEENRSGISILKEIISTQPIYIQSWGVFFEPDIALYAFRFFDHRSLKSAGCVSRSCNELQVKIERERRPSLTLLDTISRKKNVK